jgi:hypothetical protein
MECIVPQFRWYTRISYSSDRPAILLHFFCGKPGMTPYTGNLLRTTLSWHVIKRFFCISPLLTTLGRHAVRTTTQNAHPHRDRVGGLCVPAILPPKRSCCLGQRGYMFIFYCNSAWMSSGIAALAMMRLVRARSLRFIGGCIPVR